MKVYGFMVFAILMLAVGLIRESPTSLWAQEADSRIAAANSSFVDDSGERVRLPGMPKRTAVLFSSYADIWLHAGGRIAIATKDSGERGFVNNDTVLVGNGHTVNAELLLAARPDFVILTTEYPTHVKLAETLKSAGIPTALFKEETFGDYLRILKIFTDITRNERAFARYGQRVEMDIEGIKTKVAETGPVKPRVLLLKAFSTGVKAKDSTGATGVMLKELGAKNIADETPGLTETMGLESIVRSDPDFVLVMPMGDEAAAKAFMDKLIKDNPVWGRLRAVREKRYFFLPKELFQYKPNAEWADAYRYLADLLYPGTFAK